MARLESKSKMGYYRLPESMVELLASQFDFSKLPSKVYAVDLFSGCGGALSEFSEYAKSHILTYGNELNRRRYWKSKKALDFATFGPAEYCKIVKKENGERPQKFTFQLYNPPYDNIGGTRLELAYLDVAYRMLQKDGWLIGVIPENVYYSQKFIYELNKRFVLHGVRRFPEPEFSVFKQVFFFAQAVRSNYSSWTSAYHDEENYKKGNITVETLKKNEFSFLFPEPETENIPEIISEMPMGEELLEDLQKNTLLNDQKWRDMTVPQNKADFRPLMQPQPGHAAMMLAAGMVDGTVINDKILKGYSYKYMEYDEKEKTNSEGRVEKEYTGTERSANAIMTIDMKTGEITKYDSKETPNEYETFLNEHIDILMQQIHDKYEPVFDGNTDPWEEFFTKLHSPGKLPGHEDIDGLLPKQKKAVGAYLTLFGKEKQKGGMFEGDMGVGKTMMSIAIAAGFYWQKNKVKPWGVTIVLCPDHLVNKWKAQVESILKNFNAKGFIGKSTLDVDEAFEHGKENLAFLIIGQQPAKNNARWKPVFMNKFLKREVTEVVKAKYRWENDYTVKVEREINVAFCQTCGYELPQKQNELIRLKKSKTTWANKLFCPNCNQALWQETHFRTGGSNKRYDNGFKQLHGQKAKLVTGTSRGRRALGQYINRHYANRYFLIVDEAHETKGGSTNIGFATRWLTTSSLRSLYMTGTLYGGKASSLFHMLHRCLPSFRNLYGWNEVERFIDMYGLREITSDTKPEYEMSTFGFKRAKGKRSTEIPGADPGMVTTLLPYTVFLYIEDIADYLPEYEEYSMSITVNSKDPAWEMYKKKIAGTFHSEAVSRAAQGDMSLLSKWLQAELGWLDKPEQEEYFKGRDGFELKIPAVTNHTPAKDNALIKAIKGEVSANRGVYIYYAQVNRRDSMSRMYEKLNNLGIPSAILRRDHGILPDGTQKKVKNYERDTFIAKAVKAGAKVCMSSPQLVQTGLDLLDFPTIIYAGSIYSLYTLRQSSKRSWRLGQEKPVKVIFAYWADTLQQAALSRVAQKIRAANLIDGRAIAGLGAMESEGSFLNDLIATATGKEKPSLPEFEYLPINDSLFGTRIDKTSIGAQFTLPKIEKRHRQDPQLVQLSLFGS